MDLMEKFWEIIDTRTKRCEEAKTAEQVKDALSAFERSGVGESFYPGDGGELWGALREAGWQSKRFAASYYWVMTNEAGEFVSYTEGDVDYSDNPLCGK